MLDQFALALTPLAGIVAVLVVLIAGFVVKSQSALTLGSLVGFVSPPIAVGALGTGLVIAMFTAGEISTLVASVLAAIMVVLTFRANSLAAAAREDRDTAREDRAAAVVAAKDAAEAAAIHAIELAKIARSVDGVASRQVDKVATLEEIIVALRAQLAEEKNTASTLAATTAAVAMSSAKDLPK